MKSQCQLRSMSYEKVSQDQEGAPHSWPSCLNAQVVPAVLPLTCKVTYPHHSPFANPSTLLEEWGAWLFTSLGKMEEQKGKWGAPFFLNVVSSLIVCVQHPKRQLNFFKENSRMKPPVSLFLVDTGQKTTCFI